MTGALCGNIMKSGFLRNSRANILFALASVSDVYGESWYSYRAIAHLARCTRKTAITEMRWLETRGIVHVKRGPNLKSSSGNWIRRSNLYVLNLEFFYALDQLVDYIRQAPTRHADTWRIIDRAARWVEERVDNFEWRIVVELVAKSPHEIMKACIGDHGRC